MLTETSDWIDWTIYIVIYNGSPEDIQKSLLEKIKKNKKKKKKETS